MTGMGTLANTAVIVLGGVVGLVVGKRLIFCVGWNLIHGEKKIRVANLLPSLVIAIIWGLVVK